MTMVTARSLLHVTGLVVAALVLTAEGGWLLRERSAAERAVARLEQKKQERDWLARQNPAPSARNEAVVEAELAAAEHRLSDLRLSLHGRPGDLLAGPAPTGSTDAFFALANLVEKARAQAAAARVVLRADERFSFSAYANEGPAAEQVARVHRQALLVQYLLEALWEARPLALLSVRRESPFPGGAPARGGQEDYFSLDPAWSVRVPGMIDTEAIRLEFTGQTSTLRVFLGALAAFRQPVIVRSVEVEALAPAGSAAVTGGGIVPVVKQSLSKFAVTAEFVLLAPAAPAAP
jgi:hypothetical protein